MVAIGAVDQLVGVGEDDASSSVRGLDGIPLVDWSSAHRLAPDLVLIAEPPPADDPVHIALQSAGTDVVIFAPHDLEDVFDLIRDVGGRLVGEVRARRFEREVARPVAAIAGSSFGLARPRVVAIVGFEPLELAGGHSFETDLIEIAGARSVTHGSEDSRRLVEDDSWAELRPDLILVVSKRALTETEQAALEALPVGIPTETFVFDRDLFWLDDAEGTARRLRGTLLRATRGEEPRREGGGES